MTSPPGTGSRFPPFLLRQTFSRAFFVRTFRRVSNSLRASLRIPFRLSGGEGAPQPGPRRPDRTHLQSGARVGFRHAARAALFVRTCAHVCVMVCAAGPEAPAAGAATPLVVSVRDLVVHHLILAGAPTPSAT